MTWRGFLRRARHDRECADELQSYLEIETAENIARGMSPADARRAAHRKLGSPTRVREELYEMNSIQLLDSFWRDLQYAVRGMRRRPGFTAAVVVTLALGIGANTAMFSVIDGVLVKPLPYPTADRLVSLRHLAPGLQAGDLASSPTLHLTYRDQSRVFEYIGLWSAGGRTITGLGEPEQARAVWLTYGTLQALGVRPQIGRWFSAADDAPGSQSPDPVIITHGFWQRRFGGDRSVLGRRMIVDGRPAEIVGVMPAGFRFLNLVQPPLDIIMTMRLDRGDVALGPPAIVATGLTASWQGLALLKPGVTLEDANADLRRLLPLWLETWPVQPGGFSREAIEGWNITPAVRPLKADVIGNIGGTLWLLMGMLAIVLLIACANVANLMLVRSEGRRHEFALRAALGAGRLRIAKEVLVESVAFGISGGAVGLLLAFGALRLIVAIGPADLPRLADISLDPRALAFTAAASLLSSIAFGTIPAFRSAGQGGLPLGGIARNATASRERHRTRNMLVVQVALALALLVCSGLMIRTFEALRSVNPGFMAAKQVQTMRLWVPPSAVGPPERFTRVQHEVLDKIRALPGVTAAGFASTIPMEGRLAWDLVSVEGQTYSTGSTPPTRRMKFVSPGFFDAMGTRIIAGRDVTWTDIDARARVALVSENFAREVWGNPSAALGQHIHEATPPQRAPVWREIIGVVEDVHEDGPYQPAPTFAYWPVMMGDFYGAPTFGTRATAFAIRSPQASNERLMDAVRRAVWSVNPDMPVFLERTMQDLTDQSLAATSFALVMLCVAGAMALGLGIVGIYGVISYVISQRAREIGLRLALGAEPTALTRMFVLYGLALTGIGTVCGLAAAVALTRLMSSLLFGIGAIDPVTYIVVIGVLVAAAVLASYIPARRAAMTNPMTTLAAE